MTKRILHIVTNVGQYDNGDPTGLWLSGLTTAWDRFEREGFEQDIASPRGGDVPLDPRSLKFPFRNESAKSWLNNPERMALLKNTPSHSVRRPEYLRCDMPGWWAWRHVRLHA